MNAEIKTENGIMLIPTEDFLNLLKYYQYIKENDIQDDFINPEGKNWCLH